MNKKALFSAASVTVLCSTMFAAPAMAQTTADIPSNIVASQSGSANVIGGSTTTKKVGDTVPVKWTVQGHPLVQSANSGETSQALFIFLPDAVTDVEITQIGAPFSLNPFPLGGQPTYPSSYSTNIPANFIAEPMVSAEGYLEQNFFSTEYDESVTGDAASTEGGWTRYTVVLPLGGVSTFEVTGNITIQSEETYVPLRAVSKTYKCNGVARTPEDLGDCTSVKTSTGDNMAGWAPDMPGPEFSLTDENVIEYQAELDEEYGKEGFTDKGCVATGGPYSLGRIGDDLEPSYSAGQAYAEEYRLASNEYFGYVVPWGVEDGCDQAHYYINVEEPEEGPNAGDITIIDIDETNTHNETHIDNSDNSVTEDNSVTDNSETHITNNGTIINGDVYNNEYHFHGAPGVVPTAGDVIEIINNNENNNSAEGGNSESNAESNVDVDVNTGGTPTDPEAGEGDKPNDDQTPGNGDQPNEGQAPNEDDKDSSKDADKTPAGEVQAPSGEVKAPANGGTKVPSTSTTGGTNLADTSKTASQSKADAVSKSASPSRGATLANTGANGTTIASLIAAGLLAVAAGAFMVRRKRQS